MLQRLAILKSEHGFTFVIIAAVVAGALLPEIFLIVFFQRGRPARKNLRNLLFTIPIWAIDGSLVDLLYRSEAAWLGNVVTVPVVLAKICVDQFGYNPFFAAPFGVLTYEWKNSGFSLESLVRGFSWTHYRDKIVPTLLATWAVWIPLMAIIYSLPLALQFPLFSLALTFWVLLLTYMTNSFAEKHAHVTQMSGIVSPRRRRTSPMKSHEIFQHMSPDLAAEIFGYLQQEQTAGFKSAVRAWPVQRNLRPSLLSGNRLRALRLAQSALGRKVSDTLAAHLAPSLAARRAKADALRLSRFASGSTATRMGRSTNLPESPPKEKLRAGDRPACSRNIRRKRSRFICTLFTTWTAK